MTNKTYRKQRDLLIPEAERYANEKSGSFGIEKWGKTSIDIRVEWNRIFLLRMNELAIAAGLCEKRLV